MHKVLFWVVISSSKHFPQPQTKEIIELAKTLWFSKEGFSFNGNVNIA